jgi:hypothetical protein
MAVVKRVGGFTARPLDATLCFTFCQRHRPANRSGPKAATKAKPSQALCRPICWRLCASLLPLCDVKTTTITSGSSFILNVRGGVRNSALANVNVLGCRRYPTSVNAASTIWPGAGCGIFRGVKSAQVNRLKVASAGKNRGTSASSPAKVFVSNMVKQSKANRISLRLARQASLPATMTAPPPAKNRLKTDLAASRSVP